MESGGSSEMMNISMYTHVYQCRKLRFVRYVFCVSLCLILLCMPAHTYKNGWYRWQKMVCVCAYVWACGCRFLLMYCKSCSTYNIIIVYWPLCCLCTIHIVLSHCWWGQQKQHLYTRTHLSIRFLFKNTCMGRGCSPRQGSNYCCLIPGKRVYHRNCQLDEAAQLLQSFVIAENLIEFNCKS